MSVYEHNQLLDTRNRTERETAIFVDLCYICENVYLAENCRRAHMHMKDGLHLSGKGAAVFADELSAAVDSGMGTMTNIFGGKHCLN